MKTISESLADLGIRHERDEKSPDDSRHKVWDCCGVYLGRLDAHEAVELLNDIRFGIDDPAE